MITNTAKTILVDGIHEAGLIYKRNETGDETEDKSVCLNFIVDKDGSALGAGTIAITGEIKGYFIKPIILHEACVYKITGVSTPGDRTIYISRGYEKGSLDALKDNVMAIAYADAEGNFEFNNISYPDGTVSLWTSALVKDATTASLTYEVSISDYDPNIGKLFTYSFIREESDGIDNPLYTINGTCSDDITIVYVSKAESTTSVVHLMETVCASVVPSEESFRLKCSGEFDQNYIIWALSNSDGNLTIKSISVSEDSSVCLSGDTMIMMADGISKRMDNICAGDIVLSKNGTTCVNAIRRGRFNDKHILYTFEDGTIIDETHHHRFYNVDQGFWQRLQLWNIGDHAINYNGEKVALVSVEVLNEDAEMFGIWTDDGTYYANGLLSGAAFCNRDLLAEATAEQAIDMMLSTEEEMLVELMGLGGILP